MQQSIPLTPLSLFLTFLKAGGLTLGDGYATIHPVRRALVEKYGWTDEESFTNDLATVQAMPGIFNINLATYLGKQLLGWKGSLAALAGMVLPPFVLLLLFATFYNNLREWAFFRSFLMGARPAIIALLVLSCIQVGKKSGVTLSTVWIPVLAAILIGLLGVSPTYIILGLAALGVLYGVIVLSKE
ncbi:MAG: chromate transporter [Prevotellamassilia sp.]